MFTVPPEIKRICPRYMFSDFGGIGWSIFPDSPDECGSQELKMSEFFFDQW
jgi:hypothetical protein